ncbi:MAG TPA: two-component system response regulator CreB, partial [Pseudoxanthomonas sp.]|nr:two-component system response regulator CreB [Pseudoxanthomonas sp.]
MPTILVAEDEPAIADAVLYALRSEGLEAQHCLLGREVAPRV